MKRIISSPFRFRSGLCRRSRFQVHFGIEGELYGQPCALTQAMLSQSRRRQSDAIKASFGCVTARAIDGVSNRVIAVHFLSAFADRGGTVIHMAMVLDMPEIP